jgi:phage baseplate assembly protein W
MAKSTRVFSDIDLSFEPHPATKDLLVKYDSNSVKNSIKNLVMTKYYERPFRSDIGSGTYNLMFELPSPALVAVLTTDITNTIRNFEPRVGELSVNIGFSPDNYLVNVAVIFTIVNTTAPITLEFSLDRTR